MESARLSRRSAALLLLLLAAPLHAEPPRAAEAAGRIDAFFQKHKDLPAPALADDQAFVRRVYLDLTGKLPTPEETRAFVADSAADKRAQLIDKLLDSDAYATNWGRYWRDVITYHTPASGNYLRWQLFDKWWTEQLHRNRPFDQVVTALVTATGINDEQAPVNFLTSMYGNPVEIAAVTSRVFLGVQIQCAECHNAKTEPWKREQFHEFAAFFGRAKIIQHKDVEGRNTPYAIEGRADGQYRMTDKRNPDRLIDMQPKFLTGESVSIDAGDEERRAALARFMTSPKNPWFARCYTNRMWTSLMGWGFYPSVNDLGSTEIQPRYPELLDSLAKEWSAGGHDVKWLFRTIMLSRAYQTQFQAPPSSSELTAPGVCPVRLRPEQIFDNLVRVLEFDETDKTIPAPAAGSGPMVARHTGTRHMVYQAFKENPSTPAGEVHGTIPQALLMMNSTLVHTYTTATGKTVLAGLLADKKSDADIVTALYDRTLARKPSKDEQAVCAKYIAKVGSREEALEDIFWALVNSTEFLIKK